MSAFEEYLDKNFWDLSDKSTPEIFDAGLEAAKRGLKIYLHDNNMILQHAYNKLDDENQKISHLEEKIQYLHDNNMILQHAYNKLDDENQALKRRIKLLDALEAAGVDNWEWYGEATREYYNEDETL